VADFIADTGVFPGPLLPNASAWFGLLMNSERMVHRIARRRLSEHLLCTSGKGVPYDIFRAASLSHNRAVDETDDYNLSLERAAMARTPSTEDSSS
jgi:hypothetical protein